MYVCLCVQSVGELYREVFVCLFALTSQECQILGPPRIKSANEIQNRALFNFWFLFLQTAWFCVLASILLVNQTTEQFCFFGSYCYYSRLHETASNWRWTIDKKKNCLLILICFCLDCLIWCPCINSVGELCNAAVFVCSYFPRILGFVSSRQFC